MRGGPRERRAMAARRFRIDLDPEDRRGAKNHSLEIVFGIEVETVHDAEAASKRRRQETGARRRADEGEVGDRDLHRLRGRTLTDDDVELEVLHRRIEHLFDGGMESMNLVDEQHVPGLEVREQRHQIARFLDERPGGGLDSDLELVRDHVRERRLPEARRTVGQEVIHRLPALAGGDYGDLELCQDLLLSHVLRETAGPEAQIERDDPRRCGPWKRGVRSCFAESISGFEGTSSPIPRMSSRAFDFFTTPSRMR